MAWLRACVRHRQPGHHGGLFLGVTITSCFFFFCPPVPLPSTNAAPQMVVSVAAGPFDAAFGGSNMPAFLAASFFAALAAAACKWLPKPPSDSPYLGPSSTGLGSSHSPAAPPAPATPPQGDSRAPEPTTPTSAPTSLARASHPPPSLPKEAGEPAVVAPPPQVGQCGESTAEHAPLSDVCEELDARAGAPVPAVLPLPQLGSIAEPPVAMAHAVEPPGSAAVLAEPADSMTLTLLEASCFMPLQ